MVKNLKGTVNFKIPPYYDPQLQLCTQHFEREPHMDVLEYDNKVGWRQVLQNKQKKPSVSGKK